MKADHNPAMGTRRMGEWLLTWEQGYGDDFGVIMLANVAGAFREVYSFEKLAQASKPHGQAAWEALLERELERLRDFANADAAEAWEPELERLDFREAWTRRLHGYVYREAGGQTCPFCAGPLAVDWQPQPAEPPFEVAPRLPVWSCECGFEWKRKAEPPPIPRRADGHLLVESKKGRLPE